jgi:hypothetical protein
MAARQPVQLRRPLGGWIIVAMIVAIAATWVFGSSLVIRWFDAPWSIAALGPTLTGSWEGPLRARQGAQYHLTLAFEYVEAGRSTSNIRGKGRICNRHGETFELSVSGTANRAGDRITLILPKADDVPLGPSLTLDGHWNGQKLTVRPTANPFLADGTFQAVRTISTSDPDDSFMPSDLHPGDPASFETACRLLT